MRKGAWGSHEAGRRLLCPDKTRIRVREDTGLKDFFEKHPFINPNVFLGDAAHKMKNLSTRALFLPVSPSS